MSYQNSNALVSLGSKKIEVSTQYFKKLGSPSYFKIRAKSDNFFYIQKYENHSLNVLQYKKEFLKFWPWPSENLQISKIWVNNIQIE